jgi:tRNA threonylcarbamoyladenosine biosynthesis protein TsaE
VSPFRRHLPEAAATEAVGAALAPTLRPGMIVTLSGDLGTGKTTLVRGCLRGLGWTGPVKSPTYTLVEFYPISSLYFYHFDFYRFEDLSEWDTAGVADYFHPDAICCVEWPDRVMGRLPPADLELTLAHPADMRERGRYLEAKALTDAGEQCLAAIDAAPARTKSSG